MNGETRYLTEKEAVHTVDCWGPIPQEPAMRSFYLQYMRFSRNVNAPKVKWSGCFQSAPAWARLSWRLREAGKPLALCSGAGKGTFRLFPWRVGALNACGAFNFAAVPWKFARKSARPPDWFRDAWRKIEGFRPCCFPVRAGGGYGRGLFSVERVGLRWALPAPAKEP